MAIVSPTKKDFRVSQGFGENPKFYKKYGYKGHSGIDIACPIGTEVSAPIFGTVSIGNQGNSGFGKYVKITEDGVISRKEVVLAHLSKIFVKNGQKVKPSDLVGLSGNTGNSTGPHIHFEFKRVDTNGSILNYGNGFKGCENIFGKAWILQQDLKTPSAY